MKWFFILSSHLFLLFFAATADAQTVRISGISNLNLGTWMGSGNLQNQDTLCVYNSAHSNYTIQAAGGGGGGAFTIADGGNTVAYEVHFQDSGSFVQIVTPNSDYSFTGANTSSDTCGGLDNATLKVVATSAALSAAPPGSYSGSLTLLLADRP